ncbi:MAG: hypothetical protein AB2L22_11040 [Syntrophales bacterium]
MVEINVKPIHFEDHSGKEFERLAFAYILRTEEWDSINWYGQLGSDSGRDIWGVLSNRGRDSTVCFQCANRQKLLFSKVKEDLDKICDGPNLSPSKFVLIVGGKVSVNMKTRIAAYAKQKNIYHTEVWSGSEFEERLRKDTPSLIQRFFHGVVFPETVSDLSTFIIEAKDFDDEKLLCAYSSCFDRPAFTTPFRLESNLHHFKKAVSDTIEALQTGIHRLRDGTIIKRFPSITEISNLRLRQYLREIVTKLQILRASYDSLSKDGEIRPCSCGHDDCPVHFLSPKACLEMDSLRDDILNRFKKIYPNFNISMW